MRGFRGVYSSDRVQIARDGLSAYPAMSVALLLTCEKNKVIDEKQVKEVHGSMADTIHCIKKTLRLMPVEAKMLAEKADASGMCEADYLRLLISQKPNDYPEIRKLLKNLINEINHIGTNVNQIVHNHNMEFYSKEDKERLFAYLRKLNMVVKEVVAQIGD